MDRLEWLEANQLSLVCCDVGWCVAEVVQDDGGVIAVEPITDAYDTPNEAIDALWDEEGE